MRAPEPDVRHVRRADWRFLLPDPRPSRALALTGGAPADVLPLVAERVLAAEADAVGAPGTGDGCDLVVAVDPSRAVLERAYAALGPGGVCYTEWRGLGRTKRAHRRLARAGLVVIGTYWPWPCVSACRAWLPPDGTGRAHLARDAEAGVGAVRRAWRHLRVWGASARAATDALPLRVVVACRPPVPAHWLAEAAGIPSGRDVIVVLQTHGARVANKAVAFLSDAESPTGVLAVVKMARTREGARGLAGEARALRALATLEPGRLPGVPALLTTREERPTAIGQSALLGAPILSAHVVADHARLAWLGTRWLTGCARTTRAVASPAGRLAQWQRWRALVEREAVTPLTDADRRCLDSAEAVLTRLPVAIEHRDFSPWNVALRPDDSLAVLDWESADLSGSAGPDLIYFLTHLAFYRERLMGWRYAGRDRRALVASYLRQWAAGSIEGRIAHECLDGFGAAVGVARSTWPEVRLITWLTHLATGLERRDRGAPSTGDVMFADLLRAECALMQHEAGCARPVPVRAAVV